MKEKHYWKWRKGEYDLVCHRCGSTDVRIERNGPHFQRVCNKCLKWVGWLPRELAKNRKLIEFSKEQ